ncbi:hypothetical protein [Xanthobacter autotrophicus]|uniref:hypothetical protein n=1 Tax=Xanthobacter autotrophicus TaxID=280 RepID=UPI0024A653FA|nr:hypothetical protein [Xanthobacter autotrophicus]MDI4657649.1 hypothetical protein [Xanthobacter autotrophicus]
MISGKAVTAGSARRHRGKLGKMWCAGRAIAEAPRPAACQAAMVGSIVVRISVVSVAGSPLIPAWRRMMFPPVAM